MTIDIDRLLEEAQQQQQNGDIEAALASYEKLLTQIEDNVGLYSTCAILAYQTDNIDKARTYFGKAIELEPEAIDLQFNLATLEKLSGDPEAAITLLRKCIALDTNSVEAHAQLGACLLDKHDYQEAYQILLQAHSLQPEELTTLINLGHCCLLMNDYAQAEQYLKQAYQAAPKHSMLNTYLGELAHRKRQDESAKQYFQQAIDNDPSNHQAIVNLSLLELAHGDWQPGWDHYEARLFVNGHEPLSHCHAKAIWQGEDLATSSLLILGEQGIGDQLIFASMFQEIIGQAKAVTIEVNAKLVGLLSRCFPEASFIAKTLPEANILQQETFDYAIALGSLGKLLRKNDSDFPTQCSYLSVDNELASTLTSTINPAQINIGFAWKTAHPQYQHYNPPFTLWKRLLTTRDDVNWFCLQHGDIDSDLEQFKKTTNSDIRTLDSDENSNDIELLCAQIANMDLIISIDNSTLALAATMGKPCFAVLPYCAGFYWQHDKKQSVWFPEVKLFRQNSITDWNKAMQEVSHSLNKFTKAS